MHKAKMFKISSYIGYLIIAIIIITICSQSTEAQELKKPKKQYLKQVKKAFLFADIGGSLHGIAFDNRNSMYVGKNGKEILKVSPEGKISPFVVIKEAKGYYIDGPGDTFIYDMEIGKDHHLYGAAEDRILKITEFGQVFTILKQAFKGRWGACGIALDNKNNVFISFDSRVLKIQPGGENSIFIDSKKIGIGLDAVVGLEFDRTYNNLYICDGFRGGTGQLIQVPIEADGSPGKAKLIFKKKNYRPEYVCINSDNNIVIKGPENSNFVLLKNDLAPVIVEMENKNLGEIETIAFGKQGFKRTSVFGTDWNYGKVYRIDF